MEKTEQAKGAGQKKEQGQNEAAVQATTVNGLKGLDNDTLIAIAEDRSARPETRVAALREIHGRPGCQYSGLERLDIGTLKMIVENKTMPQDLIAAAADALAMPRAADKASNPDEPAKS